jgi:hypothetical protein
VPDENVTGNKSQQKQRRQQQNNGASKQNAPSGNEALSKYKSKLDICRARTVSVGFEVVTATKVHTFCPSSTDII